MIDRELGVIKVDRNNGETIATIVNFTVHPEIMWSDNLLLTAEYPGVVYRECDEKFGGITLFINGALGGMITAEKQFNSKIQHLLELLKTPLENQKFQALVDSGVLPTETPLDGNIYTEVHLIGIGNVQIATFPGEVLPKLGFRIKNRMTADHNFILRLANDELGYILAAGDYGKELYKYEKSMLIGSQIGSITTTALLGLLGKSFGLAFQFDFEI